MQKELDQIIKEYGLENTRIQCGRQRIYPPREGLNATPEQLENLKSVIEGNSVKGTLRITAGDVVIAANTAGAIDKAFSPWLLPQRQETIAAEQEPPLSVQASEVSVKEPQESVLPDVLTTEKAKSQEKNTDLEVELPHYETIPHEVEQAANQATLEEFAPSLVSPIERNSDIDYPQDAQTLDPVANLKPAIAQGSATVKEKVLSATETLALAQKNMTTFAKHVKHRGLKAWAKEQLPILQNKATELVQAQAAKIGEYVKEQAPLVKEAAIRGAKQVDEYVKEQTPIVKEATISGAKKVGDYAKEQAPVLRDAAISGAKQASAFAKEQAPIVRDAAISGAKQVGDYIKEHAPIAKDAVITGTQQAIEYAKEQAPILRDAVIAGALKTGDSIFQLDSPTVIDASKIQALSTCVLAGDSEFQGKTFNFTKTDTGVKISLKNGTPVFANGQLNPKLEESYKLKLHKLAEKVTEVKADSMIEKKAKAVSR